MKIKLITYFLLAATLLTSGCAASFRYNRGYYQGDRHFSRDRDYYRDHRR